MDFSVYEVIGLACQSHKLQEKPLQRTACGFRLACARSLIRYHRDNDRAYKTKQLCD